MPKIGSTLVIGATGKQGSAVVNSLVRRGHPVVALVRDASKAAELQRRGVEARIGDLADRASLDGAMQGISQLFLLTLTSYGAAPDTEVEQGVRLLAAAQAAGVKHIILASVAGADKNTGVPHFQTKAELEQVLRESGAPSTILRPAFFMENFGSPAFLPSIQRGVLSLPMRGDRPLQMISVEDIGEATAVAVERPDEFLGQTIELAGDELTLTEAMAAVSRAAKQPVRYEEMAAETAGKLLGPDITAMFLWFDQVGFSVDIAAQQQKHGLSLTRFNALLEREDWIRTIRN